MYKPNCTNLASLCSCSSWFGHDLVKNPEEKFCHVEAQFIKKVSVCWSKILAWEFVTGSCLKPQNPYSNHEIHVLFEHGFTWKSLNWALICMHDVTLECVAAVTDHFADAFVRENVARVYMTLLRRNDVRKLALTPFCFEKSSVRKGIFNV